MTQELSHVSTHPAVILAVDPGERSGYAILRPRVQFETSKAVALEHAVGLWGSCRRRGIVDITRHLEITHRLSQTELGRKLAVVVVYEAPIQRGHRSRHVAAGLGRKRGWWDMALDDIGVPENKRLTIRVDEWRRAVYGRGYAKGMRGMERDWRRQQLKLMAVRRAQSTHGLALAMDAGEVDADGAEAVCIGEYATRTSRVAKVITRTVWKAWGR